MRGTVLLAILMTITQSAPAGRIAGVVTDSTGGVMPGVTITLSGASGERRTAVTDGRGRYEVAGVTPGTYRAEARLGGFATRRADALKVIDNTTTEWNVSMTVMMFPLPRSATVHDPTPVELSKSVYAAALGAIRDLTTPATIRSVSLVVPAEFLEDLWEQRLQLVPKDLRDAIAANGAEAVLLNPDSLPSYGRLADPGVPAETRSVLSLSRAFVTSSGLDALVVYSHSCGNVCGTVGAIWLHRTSIAGEWRVAGLRVFWES